MAEVWRQDGFAFRIYSNDHNPSHVHVFKAGRVVIINLGDSRTAPSFRENKMSTRDAKRALAIVAQKQSYLLRKWREIHG
ncbi:MAG: DUF4160 domain-containing protein [Blastocatellia bacterium AA13]|nr:MAG: DUF4160 domain-containing protein [Blastocatellia bacterium AA13]